MPLRYNVRHSKHCTMKQLLYPILLCLILSSCLLSHQRILDHAFVFDAVRLTSDNTYYERNGKTYIQVNYNLSKI